MAVSTGDMKAGMGTELGIDGYAEVCIYSLL